MSQSPPAPPSLDVLRKEIDAIDAQMHSLLMQRGDIIHRLIQGKKTQEVGSAFRPAREADMWGGLGPRHRVFSGGVSAMRDSALFHFGFTVPYVPHFSAPAAVEAFAKSKGDLALVSATSSHAPWWLALEGGN